MASTRSLVSGGLGAVLMVTMIALGSDSAPAEASGVGTITLELKGFRNTKGFMRIALFGSKRGFPGDSARAVRTGTTRITGRDLTYTFEKVPHATYAISVLHDENGNGKMDTNFLGIPTEGGGTSNDAAARFGPPKFDDAKFVLRGAHLKMKIAIRYP